MAQQYAWDNNLRPVAPQAKWWIVGGVFLSLGAWEWALHRWFMGLPTVTGHQVSFAVGAGLVALVVLASFALIQRYEERLAEAAETLQEKNEALRALEAERDTRLVDLARDLALALTDIVSRCEVARALPDSVDAAKEFAAIETRAHTLQTVIRSMIDLKHEGEALTEKLPAILEEYERTRKAHSEPHASASA